MDSVCNHPHESAEEGEEVRMAGKVPADMPEYLREMIENDTFKDQPKEFQDRIINAYERVAKGLSSPEVIEWARVLQAETKRSYSIAKEAHLLCESVAHYLVRSWRP